MVGVLIRTNHIRSFLDWVGGYEILMGIVTFDTEQGARQIYEGGFEVTAEGNILLLDGSETSIPSSRVVGWKAQDRVIPGMPIDIVVGVFDDELEQNHQLLG